METEQDIRENTYYLYEYHKYWLIPKVEKNPKADRLTKLILDLKNPACSNHTNAVQIFGKKLSKELEDFITKDEPIYIAIVPSHTENNISKGLISIVRHIKQVYNIASSKNPLVRTYTIEKLASGGGRSIDIHLDSIAVIDGAIPSDAKVLLLDDVTTTGNSLNACKKLLYDHGAGLVIVIALAQTID